MNMSREEKCNESNETGKYSEIPLSNEHILSFLFETELNFNLAKCSSVMRSGMFLGFFIYCSYASAKYRSTSR